jgi:hypothetical protein
MGDCAKSSLAKPVSERGTSAGKTTATTTKSYKRLFSAAVTDARGKVEKVSKTALFKGLRPTPVFQNRERGMREMSKGCQSCRKTRLVVRRPHIPVGRLCRKKRRSGWKCRFGVRQHGVSEARAFHKRRLSTISTAARDGGGKLQWRGGFSNGLQENNHRLAGECDVATDSGRRASGQRGDYG